jgi:hypothetical protein
MALPSFKQRTPMNETIYIRNNGENPLFLTPKVGGERVRLDLGWNEVPSGYIERGTGGFTGKGAKLRAKGGAFAHLFNEPVKIGKRMLPILQVGTPVDGDDVHVVEVLAGLRSHYRTRQAEEVSKRELEQAKAIAGLEARNEKLTQQLEQVLARLDGEQPRKAGTPSEPADLTGLSLDEVKAAIEGLGAAALQQALGAEVVGEGRAPVVKLLKARIKSTK